MRRAGRRRHRIFRLCSAGRRGRRDATTRRRGRDEHQRPTPGDAATRRPHQRWATTRCGDHASSCRRRRPPSRRAAAAAADERALRAAAAALQVAARAGARHAVGARRQLIPDGRRRRARPYEATAADVVRWIMAKQKLTTSIAQRFMASRHVELSRALGELDLVAGWASTYGGTRKVRTALACRGAPGA